MNRISDLTPTPRTGDIRIDALLDSVSPWNFLAPSRNVLHYTFDVSTGSHIDSNTRGAVTRFNATQQQAVREILVHVTEVTGVLFNEVHASDGADFHFGTTNLDGPSTAGLNHLEYSYTYTGDTIVSLTAKTIIWLDDVEAAWSNANLAPGSTGYQTLLHEIGHALGLGHPFDEPNRLPASQDNTDNTVMSYTVAGQSKTTFQQYDLWALTWIYGNDGVAGSFGVNSVNGLTLSPSPVDTVAPTLVSALPGDGATGVPVGADIVLTFNETIVRGNGNVVLRLTSGAVVETFDAATSQRLTIEGSTLRIDPLSDLDMFSRFVLELAPGTVVDLAGNGHPGGEMLELLTEAVDGLYHFFIVGFAAAPGVAYMEQLAQAANHGMSLPDIVDVFTTKAQFTDVYPESLPAGLLAELLVTNIVKDSAAAEAKLEAIDDIAQALREGWSRGDVIHQVFGNLATKPLDDPQWGGTAGQFLNQTVVARYLTETMQYGTEDLVPLRKVLASITAQTDVSTPELIVELIGIALA